MKEGNGSRSCAVVGGCPSDYIAISIAILAFFLLLSRLLFPFLIHKIPRTNGSGFWIPVIQVFGSFNLLLSIVMSINFLNFEKSHRWHYCYVWAVWIEGPLGFGLLLSCRIAQAFQLHHIFVRSQLPPIRSYFFLPLILSPWVAGAACKCSLNMDHITYFKVQFVKFNLLQRDLSGIRFPSKSITFPNEAICCSTVYPLLQFLVSYRMAVLLFAVVHVKQPLNDRCHMGTHWIIPAVCLHMIYVAALVVFTGTIWHIEFRFNELKDLWQGILVSSLSIGIWLAAYISNEIHDDIRWLQVASRMLLLIMASVLVLVFFSISSSQPLLSQISLRKREPLEYQTMSQALGIPDSGLMFQTDSALVIDPNEPLNKLLLDKRFRQSFMAFADSCLAGESVHFYNEVHEHDKIPANDPVRRIYMARHIIEKYIVAGAAMEVNISYRARQEILTTTNLAHPDLFNNALNELMQLMKTNLAKDYWSSMFFMKFQEEANTRFNGHEQESMAGWNFSPRLSSVHGADDPFHQEHVSKGFSCDNHDLNTQ